MAMREFGAFSESAHESPDLQHVEIGMEVFICEISGAEVPPSQPETS